MAGYYARIIRRTPTTQSYFDEGDTTSLAVGWTHGCLSCSRRRPVTAEKLADHIEELEDELRSARELLAEMAPERRSSSPSLVQRVKAALASAFGRGLEATA